MDLQPYQQKVVDEKTELDEKRTKLDAFFDNPIFLQLPQDEQNRLRRQDAVMKEYSGILGDRITAFTA